VVNVGIFINHLPIAVSFWLHKCG